MTCCILGSGVFVTTEEYHALQHRIDELSGMMAKMSITVAEYEAARRRIAELTGHVKALLDWVGAGEGASASACAECDRVTLAAEEAIGVVVTLTAEEAIGLTEE